MYVENGKISHRQIFRLYVFDLMGIATLLLPKYLASLCGLEGVFAILLGTGAGFLYLFYLGWVMNSMGTDMASYLREKKSHVVRFLVLGYLLFHSILTAGFCGTIFARLMGYSLIRESSYMVILLVILLVSAYAVSGGMECRARVYEVLFWFVLLPYVGMMLLSIKDFEVAYVSDRLNINPSALIEGSFLVFLFLTPLFFSLFLLREKERSYEKSMVKTVAGAIGVTGIILLGSFYLLIGNFGEEALSSMEYPVITLMSTIQFRGNFVKRMDAFMVTVWFFTLFSLLNLHMHYAITMMKELFSPKGEKQEKGLRWWQVCIPLVLVFAVGMGLEYTESWMEIFVKYYAYVAVPVFVLLPGVLLYKGRRNAIVIVMMSLFLTGCGATELEERCFPMMIGVGYDAGEISYVAGFPRMGTDSEEEPLINEIQVSLTKSDSFVESKEKYESHLNKKADYNHLKVLVIEEALLQDEKAYREMLEAMSDTEVYPRNTYVCVVEDIEKIMEIEDKLPQDLGTYMEEYLNNREKEVFPTLGDLIDEGKNRRLAIRIPFLDVGENYVEWNYSVIVGKSGKHF